MKFKIEIDCDNAAFEGEPMDEVVCLLRDFASKAGTVMRCNDLSYAEYPIRDTNGNRVGRAWIEE